MRSQGEAIKVLIFVVVLGVLTAGVGVTMGDYRFDETREYRAVFKDLSGLKDGVDVRAAGVTVGKVTHIALRDDYTVLVTFNASPSVQLTTKTDAVIRYKNLTGDRYLDLTQDPGQGRPLAPGAVISAENTKPALDLDELFGGFKPLMQGLDPNQVNELSSSLIAVFQGQSGAVNTLLGQVATLTSTLADRDKVIGRVIDNLATALGTVDERSAQFSELIVRLQRLTTGFAKDRHRIGRSLERTQALAETTTDFLRQLRPDFVGAVKQTGRVSAALNTEPEKISRYLRQVTRVQQLIGRGGAYGSFFNLFICSLQLKVTGPDGKPMLLPPVRDTNSPRCQFPRSQR